jgi:hypothetical protein
MKFTAALVIATVASTDALTASKYGAKKAAPAAAPKKAGFSLFGGAKKAAAAPVVPDQPYGGVRQVSNWWPTEGTLADWQK